MPLAPKNEGRLIHHDSHRVHIMVGTVRNPEMVKHMEELWIYANYMQIFSHFKDGDLRIHVSKRLK